MFLFLIRKKYLEFFFENVAKIRRDSIRICVWGVGGAGGMGFGKVKLLHELFYFFASLSSDLNGLNQGSQTRGPLKKCK